jgi:lysophospholipase L1-like esterase
LSHSTNQTYSLLWKRALLLLCFALPAGFLYTKIYLQLTNTLEYHRNWESEKMGLKRPVNGAVAFYITPPALDKNRLNLGAWFGFQEVLFKEKIEPQAMAFDLFLPEGAYVNFIYNKGENGFSGIRLSRNASFPSMHFTATAPGKFLRKDPLELHGFRDGANHLRAVWGEKEISVYFNDQALGSFRENFIPQQKVGFRGSAGLVAVDNVSIKLKNSREMIVESFGNSSRFWRVFLNSLGLIFLLDILILFFYWAKSRKINQTKMFNYALSYNLLLLVIGLPLNFANYSALSNTYLFSKIYFKALALKGNYKTSIETRPEAVARLRQEYPQAKGNHPFRVLFLGSSQTWGAGADAPEDTMVRRLEDKWRNSMGGDLECINAGISGERSGGLWEMYSQEWIEWNPQLVVINLSNNDPDSSRFGENLGKFVQLNRAKGVQTVFSLEANSPENPKPSTLKNHQIMRQVAAQFAIPVVDLHACLGKEANTGFLWWDFVHLTSYGQELAAQCLEKPLEGIIVMKRNETRDHLSSL